MEIKGLTVADKEWRYKRVQDFLAAKGLKAMLVCAEARREANVRFFTGQYHRIGVGVNYVLFPVVGDPILFTASPERVFNLVTYQFFMEDHWVKDARILSIDNIVKAFEEHNLTNASVGITLDLLPAIDYLQLREKLQKVELKDISKDFGYLRRVKSEGEIDLARESARQVDLAWIKLGDELKPGMYDYEATAIMESVMWSLDTDKTFNQCLCAKKDVSRPIWPSTHSPRLIKDGDLLLAEIVSSFGGYYTQKVSIYSFGKPDSIVQELFDVSELAHKKAVEMIYPGANTKNMIAAMDKIIQGAGYLSATNFPTGPHGHLMGLDVDEGTFMPGEDFYLEAGMVLAIHAGAAVQKWVPGEPAVFGPGSTYLVTKDGVESLNKTANNLVVI